MLILGSVGFTLTLCWNEWLFYLSYQQAAAAGGEIYITKFVVWLSLLAHLILLRWLVVGIRNHRQERRAARDEDIEHQQQLMRM